MVAKQLKRWRDDLGFTQKQMAAHLSKLRGAAVTPAQVCNWENGAGVSPAMHDTLARIGAGRITPRKKITAA